ncbi:MAG TPA: beta-1,6-N-acetylglucosaminyltransferase [Parafilimonas sp.]|nr:beta-1,6-N-acetylglucosaminyltransferase [Parafilimonas sp.]
MRIAHLILAHKNPAQLEKLIIALQHSSFFLYVHIDKKVSIQPFEYLSKYNNVFFIKKRTKIFWAGYGTIQATINGIKEILPFKYDYINVISGQDFPLKTADEIYSFFLVNNGKEFITCKSVEDEWKEAEVRIKKYHLINWRIPGKYQLEKLINKILPERKFPLNYIMVGRSNWFAVTYEAAKYIIDFLDQHPEVVRFFKFSWGADELIFSVILYNSNFKDKIEDNFIYVDWSEKKAHPKILRTEDYNALVNSNKLFARKFDADADAVILEMLENFLKKR